MVKQYRVTTKVGNKKFTRIFKTVKFVDIYLKGAIDMRKKYHGAPKATFFVNGTKVTKKY